MKPITTLIQGVVFTLFCTTTSVYAQEQLKLVEIPGKGKTLTTNFNRPDVVSVAWKIDGQTVHTSGCGNLGVTVAGGHCAGSAPNQLNNPNGVFVDKDDNVWVADTRNFRIQKFTPGNRDGVTIGAELPNAPSFPVNLFVKDNGDIYVADYFEAKVKLLTYGGTEWINVAGQNNELDLVRGVWLDKNDNVYCTQYGFFFNGTVNLDGMVLKYPPNSSAFEIVAGHNGIGSELNQFAAPSSLMMDDDLNMYIADGLNDHDLDNARVLKWKVGAPAGVVVAGGNGVGDALNQTPTAAHAFADKQGNVYVSCFTTHRVTRWKKNATSGELVAGGNGSGDAPDQLSFPFGIFVKNNFLYVVDPGNERVQKFNLDTKCKFKDFKPRHPGKYTATATFEDGSSVESNSVVVPPDVHTSVTQRTVNKIAAFPNPANNSVTISFASATAGKCVFELSDVSGRVMLQKEVNVAIGVHNQTFDLMPYAKGTYMMRVTRAGYLKESLKVIRQ
jgi:hypothetical protein